MMSNFEIQVNQWSHWNHHNNHNHNNHNTAQNNHNQSNHQPVNNYFDEMDDINPHDEFDNVALNQQNAANSPNFVDDSSHQQLPYLLGNPRRQ